MMLKWKEFKNPDEVTNWANAKKSDGTTTMVVSILWVVDRFIVFYYEEEEDVRN